MPGHPSPDRIVAVFGRSQGSGYLIGQGLVLTAAHLLGDEPPALAVPGLGKLVSRVIWSRYEDDCDAALLKISRERTERLQPPGWLRFDDLAPRADTFAIGYPHVQRDGSGELDSEQLTGVLKPGTGLLTGRQVLDSLHSPPEPRTDGGSPWAGFSGAAVFHQGRIAGVVRADPVQWRHGRVVLTPASALLDQPDFLLTCAAAGYRIEVATAPSLYPDGFEEKLRDYVVRQSSTLQIIGLSRGGDDAESWPLDAGYLSLELRGSSPGAAADGLAPVAQRAEQALSGQRRILVRGSAGSGKTTLLQWLATAAARRELPGSLADLADCVPLLIRLRAVVRREELPSPEEFLALVAKPLSGHPQAAGWVTAQMAKGRILLLVDGVDEVPEADRVRTRRWLTELMDAYPDVRYVVTTRPSAVREGWLTGAGFTELELLPMNRRDVAAYIAKWHRAAAHGRPDDPRYAHWQEALTTAVVVKQDLGRLATSPLMCSLVCALNRDRNGYLPEGRMELYAAALEMLLVRRDRERGIANPQGLDLTAEQQIQLLQRLAYWLAVNGRAEIGHDRAVRIVDSALPAMPAITGGAEQVLRHLLVRSGLLRAPTAESVDFVHRTFQDYLAAKAAIEDGSLGVLTRNAHDDQWEDVLRMAVGHARPRERAELLRGLLAQAEQDPAHRTRLWLLAAASLEHATELDPTVRQEVTTAATELVPPHDDESAKELATAGPIVLELLPGPDGLDDATARAVVLTATTVAGSRAVPLLRQYTQHPSLGVRDPLAWSWDRFDAQEYGEQVIAALRHGDALRFVAHSRPHLDFLGALGGRSRVQCSGPLTTDDLLRLTPGTTELRLHENPHQLDLGAVLQHSAPAELWISNCTGESSLAPLAESRVEQLYLHWNPRLQHPEALADAPALRTFAAAATPESALPGLRLPAGLRELHISQFEASRPRLVELLGTVTALEFLSFDAQRLPVVWRGPLAGLASLRTVRTIHEHLDDLRHQQPLPQVSELHLLLPDGLGALREVARAYPGIRTLRIEAPGLDGIEAQVRAQLGGLTGCAVEIHRHSGPVVPNIFGIGKSFVPTVTGFSLD
ncbi:NACHT domain-containing protein [Streptacidiphilus cavernicola]|uniref:NACHT domain-containing protein n=1 Tax=Streptacidiphilus cavernicola TaxID=3342716 RepID=A0ABV6VXK3_9ACTN